MLSEADPIGGGAPPGGALPPPTGGGMGGGMPPPPMGGGMGGMGGGLGGGMGGMGGPQGGEQQPVPIKTIQAMDVWEILKHAVKDMEKYDDLSVFHREKKHNHKPDVFERPERKSSLMS